MIAIANNAILTTVPEVRHDKRNVFATVSLERIDECECLNDVVAGRLGAAKNDRSRWFFENAKEPLAVGELAPLDVARELLVDFFCDADFERSRIG